MADIATIRLYTSAILARMLVCSAGLKRQRNVKDLHRSTLRRAHTVA